MVIEHQQNWHNGLSNVGWEDIVTPKVALGTSFYFLVYGNETILLPNILLPSLQLY